MSTSLSAIIIDDEIHCRKTLDQQLKWTCPEVTVVSSCNGSKEGIEAIKKFQPDLVFLDIEMPEMNGFELLETLGTINFETIFTTAYDAYAVRAFNESAVAYLLKPIVEEDLRSAIDKVISKRGKDKTLDELLTLFRQLEKNGTTDKIAFPTIEGLEFVSRKNIIRCEADSNYTKIFIQGQRALLISKTLKDVSALINRPNIFLRPHASHLININYIKKYLKGVGGQIIMDDGTVIPVSKGRKDDFIQAL